jgi:hypothetical protein
MMRNNEVNWKYQFTGEDYALSPEMTLGLDTREITIGQLLHDAGKLYRADVTARTIDLAADSEQARPPDLRRVA